MCGYGDSEYRHQIIVGMGLCGEWGISHDDSDRNRVAHGGRIHTGSCKLMDFLEGQVSLGGNGVGIDDDILFLLGTDNIHIHIIKVRFIFLNLFRSQDLTQIIENLIDGILVKALGIEDHSIEFLRLYDSDNPLHGCHIEFRRIFIGQCGGGIHKAFIGIGVNSGIFTEGIGHGIRRQGIGI